MKSGAKLGNGKRRKYEIMSHQERKYNKRQTSLMVVKVTLKRKGEWQQLGKTERNREKEIKLEFIEQKQSNVKREREREKNGRWW